MLHYPSFQPPLRHGTSVFISNLNTFYRKKNNLQQVLFLETITIECKACLINDDKLCLEYHIYACELNILIITGSWNV